MAAHAGDECFPLIFLPLPLGINWNMPPSVLPVFTAQDFPTGNTLCSVTSNYSPSFRVGALRAGSPSLWLLWWGLPALNIKEHESAWLAYSYVYVCMDVYMYVCMCVCVWGCVCVGNPRASQQVYPSAGGVCVCVYFWIYTFDMLCGETPSLLWNGAVYYYIRHWVERWWNHQLCSRLLAYFHVVQFAGSIFQHPLVE